MLSRRDVLRRAGLAALAIAAVGILDATLLGSGISVAQSGAPRARPRPGDARDGAASMRALGSALWPQLAADSANQAISPFSVAVALGMTVNGARGRTLDEMLEVLAAGSAEDLDRGCNAVTRHIESLANDGLELRSGNTLFGQDGVSWKSPFLDALARYYGAGVQQVDYESDVDGAREAINDWTARQTNGKIVDLIPAGALTDATRLTLVNALYMKATWSLFDEEATQDQEFHVDGGETVPTAMMHGSDGTAAVSGDGWRGARIDYDGGTVAMSVVLPDQRGLAAVDAFVAGGGLEELATAVPGEVVSLTMPKWTFRVSSSMTDALEALGMATAFDPEAADFSAMTEQLDLFVSEVLHQVYVAVDEDGTEAAAATAVSMGDSAVSVREEPPPLVLDRPFLFVIHDTEHDTPLFVGRVGNPSEHS